MDRALPFELSDHLSWMLSKAGFQVSKRAAPLEYHSHCVGADAMSFTLQALGVPSKMLVASEIEPVAAAFHMWHHKVAHLIAGVQYVSDEQGPCFTHGGKLCKLGGCRATLLVASFVCTPYSRQNPNRHTIGHDPIQMPGVSNATDTFHHLRKILCHGDFEYFILENVDGIKEVRDSIDTLNAGKTPLDFIMDDPAYGLRTILDKNGACKYAVAHIAGNTGTSASLPQARPRVIIFGARCGGERDGEGRCKKLLERHRAYMGILQKRRYHIEHFLEATRTIDVRLGPMIGDDDDLVVMEDLKQYCVCLADIRKRVTDMNWWPVGGKLPHRDERPSRSLSPCHYSARMRAQADILSVIAIAESAMYVKQGGNMNDVHPLGDLSQSVERKPLRVDGQLMTLCIGSVIFSFKYAKPIAVADLMASMGIPRGKLNLKFMPSQSSKRVLVGNGYITTVVACALASVLEQTGHLEASSCDVAL
jgi:site-specific DNA-cytosine methylase